MMPSLSNKNKFMRRGTHPGGQRYACGGTHARRPGFYSSSACAMHSRLESGVVRYGHSLTQMELCVYWVSEQNRMPSDVRSPASKVPTQRVPLAQAKVP